MHRLGYVPLLTVILIVIAIITGWISAAACSQPADYGLPAKLTNLTGLQPVLQRKDLTSAQKTEVLLFWLNEERRQPTPTSKGLGGGDITSGYIQAQIIKSLNEVGNPLALRTIDSDKNADANIRDAARLALGLMGDITQIPKLIGILEKQNEPYFRVTAAEALGGLGATEAVPALQRALKDRYSVIGGGGDVGPPPITTTVYPVRRAAETALRVLKMQSRDPELKHHVQTQIARFKNRLDMARKEAAAAE